MRFSNQIMYVNASQLKISGYICWVYCLFQDSQPHTGRGREKGLAGFELVLDDPCRGKEKGAVSGRDAVGKRGTSVIRYLTSN